MKTVIAGGGAAGFFAAITCKSANPQAEVIVLENSSTVLGKVFLSGGKRCNLSNNISDPELFSAQYPRGKRLMKQLFYRFNPKAVQAWFLDRGVQLKIEPDGRIFPASNKSQTIIDCLLNETRRLNISVRTNCGIKDTTFRETQPHFIIQLTNEEELNCDKLLIATGGTPDNEGIHIAKKLGHQIQKQIPSLFTFKISDQRINTLPGVSIQDASITIPGTKFKARGGVLLTHHGLSGPAILRLSSFAAKELNEKNYNFSCRINWLPQFSRTRFKTVFYQ